MTKLHRTVNWVIVILVALVAFMIYGLNRASGQANNQAYIGHSSCESVAIDWKAVPTAYAPVYSGGNLTLYCPWQSYTWRYPSYLLNEGRDYTWYSAPVSDTDIPRAGSAWNQCLATGYVQYIYNGNLYNKVVEYPVGYDGYLDCWMVSAPFLIKDESYLPLQGEGAMSLPYPEPMEGMVLEQELESDSFILELDNPYP
jgi:hypothetical protein